MANEEVPLERTEKPVAQSKEDCVVAMGLNFGNMHTWEVGHFQRVRAELLVEAWNKATTVCSYSIRECTEHKIGPTNA